MKKSKFLKNSRDMLSRSFNPSKCKTSLRLAGSRMKLLRNKKEVQLKQMKREIAQLLESGQDQTARIRVEHVIREEKMMAAYDLMEIYCELIVARLPIIESQKICPIDLKEAIASVVFASPRCGDVPELLDVRKHFTEKYGKDFTTAALELRPDCGVSRMLVEKLSAVAPDGQTKTKILSAIAEEHNVKWEPKSFEENSVPASDLLTGPSTFRKEHFERPDVQVPQSNNKVHGSPLNFTQVDNRASMETGRLPSSGSSGINTSIRHEARPPAGDERAHGSSNTISLDRHKWNMEFKDATSAAQAAAESAELASMAARAAAQLSSRDRHDYSTESHNSDTDVLKHGGTEAHMNSNLSSRPSSQESMNRSFSGHTRSQDEQIDRMKPNNLKTDVTEKYSQSATLKSKASTGNDSLDHGVPVVDGYSQKNSLKEVYRGEVSTQRRSFKAEIANGWQEKSENARGERIISSHSHSSISNDVNLFSNPEDIKFEYGAVEDSFLGFGKKGTYGEESQTDSRESASVVFDKSDSDSENHTFDLSPTYDELKQRFHLPLSGKILHDHISTNTDPWSPRSSSSKTLKSSSSLFPDRKSSPSDFSERSMDVPNTDDSMPVRFDESDGSTSESYEDINRSTHGSESYEDINRSRHGRIRTDFLSGQNQSFGSQLKDKSRPLVGSPLKGKGSPGSNRKQLSPSFDDGLKSEHMDRERNQGKKLDTGNSSPESEGGLDFERLTGGFRHRGYNHPPYLKKRSDVSSSFNKKSEETAATADSPRIGTMFEHQRSRTPYLQSELDSDSSEEEESLRKSSDHEEIYTPSVAKEEDIIKTKPSLAASNSFFGPDSDEDLQKESFGRRSHLLRGGISRRTKAFPSSSGKNNYSEMQQVTSDSDDSMDARKPTKSYSSVAQQQFQSTKGNPSSEKVASKPTNARDQYNSGKTTPWIIQESKVVQKSSSIEESPIPQRKTEVSISRENREAATLNKSKDSSNQKASHVHPKLPDYDTLVQSLRKSRS